jgi:hypothetical protein
MEGEHKNPRETRDDLAAYFAEVIGKYQDDHSALMKALYDDHVSIEEFERLSEQVHQDIIGLKHIKAELKQQRDRIRDTKG